MNITIVGAGFAGVKAALELAKDASNHITVITDKPDFQYYPALFNSATGYSHLESWVPLGEIFAEFDNIKVHIDTIVGIDHDNKQLHSALDVTYEYEVCILAVGMVTTYFGIKGLDQYSYGIKSESQIRALKERLYRDIAEKGELDKNYVIVGAGPTGTELAGAFGTYVKKLCAYYGVKRSNVKVRLIEASPRVLPHSHESISRKVEKRLEDLGVQVQTGVAVEEQNAKALIAGGRPIATHTVIWTSGVSNNPLFAAHPHLFTPKRCGKVEVDEYMSVAPDLYVIGDNADTPHSGLAQTALHDGVFVARNLARKKQGLKPRTYQAVQPASAVPVGENWAAFEYRGIRMTGSLGALMRRIGDFHGYSEILPIGQALRPWRAERIYEKDYFAPEPKQAKVRSRKKS